MAVYEILDVEADLLEYSDFEEVGSVSRAKSYVTAARRWFVLIAGSASNESSSMSRNVQQVETIMKRAQQFISANDTTQAGRVRFLSVEGGFQ